MLELTELDFTGDLEPPLLPINDYRTSPHGHHKTILVYESAVVEIHDYIARICI